MEIKQKDIYFIETVLFGEDTSQVTFIRTCSVVQRLLQPASAPLELVPAVEDIGLVAVDSSGKAEEPD